MTRRILSAAVASAVTLTLAAGCDAAGDDGATPPAALSPAPSSAVPASATPLPTSPPAASPPPATSPPPAASPPPADPSAPVPAEPTEPAEPAKLKRGSKGDAVVAVQQRLTELGYWNGKADGTFGALTQQGVYAVQKAAGLSRDGVVGPKTKKAIEDGVRPKARSRTGYVVEIDKKRQLLMLVDDGEVQQVFNTSTGSGERYEQDGSTHIASTPAGRFTVSRQIDGWRNAPLGMLWRPKYFNGGIAVHGAHSIPPYPASHGCARLSIAAMNHLWTTDKLPRKTRVWVY